jgi:hypothetical protein
MPLKYSRVAQVHVNIQIEVKIAGLNIHELYREFSTSFRSTTQDSLLKQSWQEVRAPNATKLKLMNYGVIPAALLISLAIIFIFSLTSRRPMGGLWIVMFIIFLATLSGQLWIRPFGPVYWGISWVPLIMVALFFFFLIFALLPLPPETKDERAAANGTLIAMGAFFWIIMILLIISIVIGYYRMSYITA